MQIRSRLPLLVVLAAVTIGVEAPCLAAGRGASEGEAMRPLIAIGWLGNGFYFLRFFVQWIRSERARTSVAPVAFWWLSLGGATCLGAYAYAVGDTPLFLGYVVTFCIYLRNTTIAHLGPRAGRVDTLPALFAALFAGSALVWLASRREMDGSVGAAWIAVAFLGQAIFSSRFVVQWYATEKRGRAHFPRAFWWISLVGNALLLAYAIRRGDPIFIAGFALGPIVQVRNLMLSRGPAPQSPNA